MKRAILAGRAMDDNGTTGSEQAQRLGRQAFFQGLPLRHLELLAEVAMLKEFETGEEIFREGDPANRFYLIEEGEVVLESRARGEVKVLQTIGPNEVLGWSWLFPPYYWRFDARATKATRATFFYGTWLRENCDRDHDFGFEMMKRTVVIVMQRLQAARAQLHDSAG